MTECIALLRGINVGKAKRIAMVDLRNLLESQGFSAVRTLLNSGNVIFEAAKPGIAEITAQVEAGIKRKFGFHSSVVVVTAGELRAIIKENNILEVGLNPSRLLVAFVANQGVLSQAKALLSESWAPEAFAVGTKAAYLWCPNGSIDSKLLKSFARVTGEAATTRNWATVLKLQAMVH
jgi:uncharacterized protein (DUF1697 family)